MDTARGGFIGFVVAAVFLAFMAGAFVVLSEVPPFEVLRNAYRGGEALIAKETQYLDPFTTDHWQKARSSSRGVTLCEADAFAGYTLYSSGDGSYAQLIAMDGRVAHEWSRPFSEVWNAAAAVEHPQRDELIFFHKARVLPNGDLLALYEAAGDTPWGYGLVKLDRNAEVIWAYLQHAHHDFDIAEDGRIVTLIQDFTNERLDEFPALERPRIEDFLVVLSPEGEELKRISLTRAMLASRFKALLYTIPSFALADPLHANAVEVIDPARAGKLPGRQPDQVLLSFREPGAIAVLDLATEEIVWATRGPWIGQHDPSLLPDGNILLFDNIGNFQSGNTSQVIEVDPETLGIAWRYSGLPGRPFASIIRSSAQRLPNGNTLITESDGGRLFEVTRDGQTVWEYLNPVRGGDRDEYIPVLSWGQRIDPAVLEPEFRDALGPLGRGCGREQTAAVE
jgi:hypothetical protein